MWVAKRAVFWRKIYRWWRESCFIYPSKFKCWNCCFGKEYFDDKEFG